MLRSGLTPNSLTREDFERLPAGRISNPSLTFLWFSLRYDKFSGVRRIVDVEVADFLLSSFSSTSSPVLRVQEVGGSFFDGARPSTNDGRGTTSCLMLNGVADDSDLVLGH